MQQSGRPFIKMHGLGNDFVVVDARTAPFAPGEALAQRIADRREGVGCDQLVVMQPPSPASGAEVYMHLRNADGGEIAACGNATRCVASLIMAERNSPSVVVETRAGLLRAWAGDNGAVAVDMGTPGLDWRDIPLARNEDTLALDLQRAGLRHPVAVSMGNPHAVFFVPDAQAVPLSDLGPSLEHDPLFPERANISAAEVKDSGQIRLRVWERGTGITRACGTAACATAVAAVRRGLCDRRVAIDLDGGPLTLEWRAGDGHVLMEGPVATSFTGIMSGALLSP